MVKRPLIQIAYSLGLSARFAPPYKDRSPSHRSFRAATRNCAKPGGSFRFATTRARQNRVGNRVLAPLLDRCRQPHDFGF